MAGRRKEQRGDARVGRAGGCPAGTGPGMGGGAAGGIRGHAAHAVGPARPERRMGQRHHHATGACGLVRRSGIPEGRRGRGAGAAVVHRPARTTHGAGACAGGRGRPGAGRGRGVEPADVARHGADRQDPATHAGGAGAPGRRTQPVHHRAGRLARGPGLQRALPALRQRRAAADGVRRRERPPHLPDPGPGRVPPRGGPRRAHHPPRRAARASTLASGSGAATRGAAGTAIPWSSRRRTSTASTGSGDRARVCTSPSG